MHRTTIALLLFALLPGGIRAQESVHEHCAGHAHGGGPAEHARAPRISAPCGGAAAERTARLDALQKAIEDQGVYVEASKQGIHLAGYVDASYAYNLNGGGTTSGINGTPEAGGNGVTGLDSQDFSVNSVRLHLARHLPEENTWAAGFALEMEFGDDLSSGVGHGHEGEDHDGEILEIHEAVVEFRIPVGNGLDVGFGRWHSLTHYENDARPFNNHFSFGLLRSFLEPFEHTGVLLTYPVNDLVTAQLGIANGWGHEDLGDSSFLDGADFAKMLTGRLSLSNSSGNASAALAFSYSLDGEEQFAHPSTGFLHHDHRDGEEHHHEEVPPENGGVLLIHAHGTWLPLFAGNRLMIGANFDMLTVFDNLNLHDHENGVNHGANTATAWGLGLYAKYQVSDIVSLATRAEYLHSDDGTLGFADGLVPEGGAASSDEFGMLATRTDLWSFTATAGFDLAENLLLRLEYRLDLASSDGGDIDGDAPETNIFDNNRGHQHTIAINAAYLFW